jgi:hypothetical protein
VALNGLDIMACDYKNAYLNANVRRRSGLKQNQMW